MQCNQAGIDLIKDFEGFSSKSYLCPAGIPTIAYGHTGGVQMGMTVTKEKGEAILREDLWKFERAVERLVKVPLNSNQFSALVCFAFNVGAGNLEKSTLLKLLNKGWYEQVPTQLMRWNKANGEVMGGLSRRRAAEAKLWNKTMEG